MSKPTSFPVLYHFVFQRDTIVEIHSKITDLIRWLRGLGYSPKQINEMLPDANRKQIYNHR